MLGALGLSGLFAIYIAEGLSSRFFSNVVLLGAFILSNSIFYFLARGHHSDRYFRGIVLWLIIFEVLFITLAMYANGGLESQVFILYVVPILMSAAVLRGLWTYLTSIGTVVIISAFLWADYEGWITSAKKLTYLGSDYQYVLNTIVFIGLVILLITYLASYIINLLQQKERQALANLEALTRAQAIARLGSWEWSIQEDAISWSEELYKMFGLRARGAITYETYLERIHPDDRKHVARTIERSLKTGRPYQVTHRVVANGKTRTIRGEGRVVKDASGEPIKIIGTAQDITAEQELEQAQVDFVSIASHQLRTPATEVKMLLALLRDGYSGELTPEQHKLIETAYQTNERQIKIANDLLGVARLDAGRIKLHKKPLELGQWLSATSENMRPILEEKNQQFVFKPLRKTVTIKADAERLQLAVENLIDNASKYTPAGGTVTLSYSAGASHAVISVRDTGIGIAKSDQKDVFNIYTRVEGKHSVQVSGSGLGLYLVKKIVDLHHGKATITSRPKSGSTFRIHLPY
ncbi:MAG: sensor histidine kinase [Acidobacteriota bacterium]